MLSGPIKDRSFNSKSDLLIALPATALARTSMDRQIEKASVR
jgi:hypothetical protein